MFAQHILPKKKHPHVSPQEKPTAEIKSPNTVKADSVTQHDSDTLKTANLKTAIDTTEQIKEQEAKLNHKKEVRKKFREAVRRAMYIHRWFELCTPTDVFQQESPSCANKEAKLSYAGGLSPNGVYKITLNSQSNIGVFESEGTAIIARLPDNSYEIKAFFDPNKPKTAPWYAITLPYYIHATARETSDNKTFLCSGKVYVQKSIMYKLVTKVVEGNDVEVKFGAPIGSKDNTYQFSQNPITLFGVSPGKMTNIGTLTKVSDTLNDTVLDKAWKDNNLDEALNLSSLRK